MTRDDIILMGVEAGLLEPDYPVGERVLGEMTRFAHLAVAAERKASAEHYLAVMRKAIEEEREACAELMERQHAWITNTAAANAIRERINT